MMKKTILACLTAACLLLGGCGGQQASTSDTGCTVACTAWPVYCFTQAVAEGAEGITVTPVITDVLSCIHDYTLTVENMKVIDRADLLVCSGAGLEEAMEDALAASDAPVIDASQGIDTLPSSEHDHGGEEHEEEHDHDHEEEPDPHIWMDPQRAQQMVRNICAGLSARFPEYAQLFEANADTACARLQQCLEDGREQLASLPCRYLINFHDGFAYFAQAFDLTILDAIEEEAGSEASARDIVTVCQEIEAYSIPAIFVETNGSDATAKAISRETGCRVGTLSMIMNDNGQSGLACYLTEMQQNFDALTEAMT